MKELIGTGVALVTPFTEEGQVDHIALSRLVNYQIENGIDYLVVLGTTGEAATLSPTEKAEVMSTVVRINSGRLPLVAGVGGNNTAEVVKELKTGDFNGFSAILSVSPYYNKPSQEGIYKHFEAVAINSPLPVIVYNVPPRTGSNMAAGTSLRLARDFEHIVAIKEAAGDFDQALELLRDKPDDFLVISGEDMLALPMVLAGASGVISVIGQGLPKEFSEMIKLGREGSSAEAYARFFKLMKSIELIFEEGNPSGIKCLLNVLNILREEVRLPLVPASTELSEKMIKFVVGYKKAKNVI